MNHRIISIQSHSGSRDGLFLSYWLPMLASLMLLGCHGTPLEAPGYRDPVIVGGEIASDTTWRASNSPYRVVEDLIIPSGISLMVEAGTTILVDWNRAIQVQGEIHLLGTQSNHIIVQSDPGVWSGFLFSGHDTDSSTLHHVDILYAITGIECDAGASPLIESCRFLWGDSVGVKVDSGGNPSIHDCEFVNNRGYNAIQYTAIYVAEGGSPEILRCQIRECSRGIRFMGDGTARIDSNGIRFCEFGLIWESPDSMVIQGNTLFVNDLGIAIFSGSPTLLANNFSYHGEAVRVEGVATPTAHFNSFIGTRKWAWKHLCPNDVDATQNWWGTTDVDSINALIYDQQDDSLAGTVNFEPFLTSPIQ